MRSVRIQGAYRQSRNPRIGQPGTALPTDISFDYDLAFSRNIGWVTRAEQEKLKRSRVAVAGLGGVGGAHVLTLARLGISSFHIADFDDFGVQNFNRQAGAFVSTVGERKASVIERMAHDVNPEAEISVFPEGVTPDNVDRFLSGVDVYVDGIDFFAMEARRMVFAECHRRGIPAITAAPLGMGVSLLYFRPGGMSFEQYFRLEGVSADEQYVRFMAGLSPAMLQRHYLVDDSAVNFAERRGPSTVMACELCAGVMGTATLQVLLRRGALKPAPHGMHFDAFQQKLSTTWRPFGNANPLQRVLLGIIRRRVFGGVTKPAAH